MTTQDVRWIQRFNHLSKAFAQLKEAVELSGQRKLSKLEEQGLIQAFEYTQFSDFHARMQKLKEDQR